MKYSEYIEKYFRVDGKPLVLRDIDRQFIKAIEDAEEGNYEIVQTGFRLNRLRFKLDIASIGHALLAGKPVTCATLDIERVIYCLLHHCNLLVNYSPIEGKVHLYTLTLNLKQPPLTT